MRDAEQVTFGGSGFERAAELRGDAAALDALRAASGARAVTLWRGKPLVAVEGERIRLLRLPLDHPLFADCGDPALFLGLEADGSAVFAHDLSHWEPADQDTTQIGAFLDPSRQTHPAAADAEFAELRAVMTGLSPRDAELAATTKAVLSWHRSHRFCALCGSESASSQAGWQRTCPACGGHHFPRTDPVVIMLVTRGNEVLVGRSPGWPDGMYSLLAGFVEPGETLEAAVRREVFEETGIRVGAVSYLASQPWAFPTSLMFGCRGEGLPGEITLDRDELDDALWVGRERMARIFAGEDAAIRPARRGAIAHFLIERWLTDRLE